MINKYGITHTGLLDSDLNEEKLLAMGLISKTGLFDAKPVEKVDPKVNTGSETTGNTETHTGTPDPKVNTGSETTGNTETHTGTPDPKVNTGSETTGNTETHTGTPDPKVNTGSETTGNTETHTGTPDPKVNTGSETTGNTETHTGTPDPKVNTGSETHTESNTNPEASVIPTPTVPNSDGLVSTETYSGAEGSETTDPKPNGKPAKPKRGSDVVTNAETDIETSTDAETADVAAESEDLRTSGRSRGSRANTNPMGPKTADKPEDHAELDVTKPSGEDIPMDYL